MTSQTPVRFNLALKLAVLQSGRTQRQIATLAGIDETRLSRIISQQVRPWPDECRDLARVLRRPVLDLFPGVQTQPRRRKRVAA